MYSYLQILLVSLDLFLDESDETDGLLGRLDESLIGKTRSDKLVIYWVSYLDHQQRVLLFTQDERIAKGARKVCVLSGIIRAISAVHQISSILFRSENILTSSFRSHFQ